MQYALTIATFHCGTGDLPVTHDYNIFNRDIATMENSMGDEPSNKSGDQQVAPTIIVINHLH
ncbi:MAG: hypothetical protein BGO29_09150 [Bacteroidales bacterium 36-12]|nr:MAG: hypothetical protein BGO29_09150 [Bacteroidales bacterium 36-12]